MKHFSLSNIQEKELYPGFIARIIHTERQSISYVKCLEGAVLPPHKHEEEQVLNLLEGEMTVTVDGQEYRIRGTKDGTDLRAAVYDLVRERGWALRELRRDVRTLETVFNELATAAEDDVMPLEVGEAA